MLKASIIGNLGGDPETRYSANGSPYLRFNVAAGQRVRDQQGQWSDATEWVRVTVFGNRADTLGQYLKKGSRVYVSGRLEARPWTDRTGNINAGLELLANDVEFMSSQRGPDVDFDDLPTSSVAAERRDARRMPEAVAVTGGRPGQGSTAVADRDGSDLDDLPF